MVHAASSTLPGKDARRQQQSCQSLGIQVCKEYQLLGLTYVNNTYFGLLGSPENFAPNCVQTA